MPVVQDWTDTARFVELLSRETRRGFSVIPLVGSGVSAPSGILTGEAFGEYLLVCVWDALDRKGKRKRLRLTEGFWPATYSPEDLKQARDWFARQAARLPDRYTRPDTTRQRDPLTAISQEALGSLADWRSTLFFLARLRSPQNHPDKVYNELGSPDPRIIDSFNYHITRGHTHNLGHQMLSFLTRLLRIRTVLTTNFDTLLEQAFTEANMPLDVFDVHLAGNLPDPRLVRSQLSLIKLHGSRFETRADLSLDNLPSVADHESFRGYFRSDVHSLPAHLLVLGFSGRDRRIIALIRDLLAARESDSNVFWVCHRQDDVHYVRQLFQGTHLDPQRLIITHGRADLLLFELYQRFVSTLPPAGSTFEFAQYTPPVALSFYQHENGLPLKALLNAIDGLPVEKEPQYIQIDDATTKGNVIGRLLVVRGLYGLSSLAEIVFSKLKSGGRHVLWFEMDDFCDPQDLAACILQCVAAELGQFDLNVVTLSLREPDTQRIREHFGIRGGEWVLFVYGRQSAGTSAGWENLPWTDEHFRLLWELFEDLEKIGFTIVYMPLSEDRKEAIVQSVSDALGTSTAEQSGEEAARLLETFNIDPHVQTNVGLYRGVPGSLLNRKSSEVLNDVRAWSISGGTGTTSRDERLLFLYVMTLFRQSRHISALCSEAAFPDPHRFNTDGVDNDFARMNTVERWAVELTGIGLLRRKEGGFLWMHRDLRETLRLLLERDEHGWVAAGRGLLSKRSRSHHWLAEWYLRAFRSTGNGTPFVESFYHRLQCIRHLSHAEVPSHLRADYARAGGSEKDAIALYRKVECQINLREAAKLLNSGKRVPVLNLEEEQRQAWFDELPQDLGDIVSEYGCAPLWDELQDIARRLKTLASLQSRDPESVSSSLKSRASQGAACGVIDLERCEETYARIKAQVPLDQFQQTRRRLIDLLKDLWFEIDRPSPDSIRRATVIAISKAQPSSYWRLIMKVLRRLAHLYVKETAIGYQKHEILTWTEWPKRGPVPATSPLKRDAATACSLLMAAERFGWFLDPSSRDSQMIENVACQSLHGLALGYLDRFYEARRKLDEASGSLAASSLARDPLELAILELRRAVLFLLHARHTRVAAYVSAAEETADASRSASALVEDSWRCLERAHDLLAGNSRIVSWWERLYTTQLRALAFNQELLREDQKYNALMGYPESCRDDAAERALRSSLLLRPFRTRLIARVCHYYVLAVEPARRRQAAEKCVEILDRESERLKSPQARPDDVVLKYFEEVCIRLKTVGAGQSRGSVLHRRKGTNYGIRRNR